MQADSDEAQAGLELAALFERYAPGMLAYMRMHAPSPADAEDLVVEVFLAALESKSFASLSERAQLLWLWRVARNKAIDAYRYASRRQYVALEDVGESLYESEARDPETLARSTKTWLPSSSRSTGYPPGSRRYYACASGKGYPATRSRLVWGNRKMPFASPSHAV